MQLYSIAVCNNRLVSTISVGGVRPAPSDTAATAPGSDVISAVMSASRALVAISARSLAAVGEEVTLPQYRALVLLASGGPLRSADLAAALAVSPSTATRMCDRLARKRLVRRSRAAEDRRTVRVTLTAAGKSLVDQVSQRRRAELQRVVAALPDTYHQPLIAALGALADAAGETPEPGQALGWAGP
jgi:DNA-binding MarR family transcriptional regulator